MEFTRRQKAKIKAKAASMVAMEGIGTALDGVVSAGKKTRELYCEATGYMEEDETNKEKGEKENPPKNFFARNRAVREGS